MTDCLIRAATLADIPQMLVNSEAFLVETGYEDIPFDADSMAHELERMIGDGLAFIAEQDGLHVGGIGAIKGSMFINESVLLALERFWWVVPSERAREIGRQLIDRLIGAARATGCVHLTMIALVNENLPKVERAYQHLGFKPVERSYMMRL